MLVRAWTLFVVLSGLSSCADPSLLAPDNEANGALGQRGKWGALLLQERLPGAGDSVVAADIVVPSLDAEHVAPGTHPLVLFVQGGLVTVERYHWLMAHLASRGFVVVAPHHELDLAFFAQDNGTAAVRAVRQLARQPGHALYHHIDQGPATAVGHSLGGVVASKAWLHDNADIKNLALLASLPDGADDVAVGRGRVLTIAGENDGRIGPDEVRDGAEPFTAPTARVLLAGVNHTLYSDDNTDADLQNDGPLDVALATGRAAAMFFVDALVEKPDVLDDPRSWPALASPLNGATP